MGLLNRFFKKSEPVDVKPAKVRNTKKKVAPVKPRKTKEVQIELTLLEKEKLAATSAGQPWVSVLRVELDPTNVSNGAMTLDWNDIFVARLIKAGYKGTDVDIVDQWFSDLCRNVLAENHEQLIADPEKRDDFLRNK